MRSNVLSVAAVTFACFFATVQAQTWYAVFTDNGVSFLDSNHAKIETTHQTSVADVASNTDKGERFRFPTGSGGILVSEAHNDHAVGYDENANEFHADFSTSHLNALVTVTVNGNTASFCNNGYCIGDGGKVTSDAFEWTIQEINPV